MGHSTPAVRAISEIGAHQHYFPRSLMFVLNMCRYKLNSEKKKKKSQYMVSHPKPVRIRQSGRTGNRGRDIICQTSHDRSVCYMKMIR